MIVYRPNVGPYGKMHMPISQLHKFRIPGYIGPILATVAITAARHWCIMTFIYIRNSASD